MKVFGPTFEWMLRYCEPVVIRLGAKSLDGVAALTQDRLYVIPMGSHELPDPIVLRSITELQFIAEDYEFRGRREQSASAVRVLIASARHEGAFSVDGPLAELSLAAAETRSAAGADFYTVSFDTRLVFVLEQVWTAAVLRHSMGAPLTPDTPVRRSAELGSTFPRATEVKILFQQWLHELTSASAGVRAKFRAVDEMAVAVHCDTLLKALVLRETCFDFLLDELEYYLAGPRYRIEDPALPHRRDASVTRVAELTYACAIVRLLHHALFDACTIPERLVMLRRRDPSLDDVLRIVLRDASEIFDGAEPSASETLRLREYHTEAACLLTELMNVCASAKLEGAALHVVSVPWMLQLLRDAPGVLCAGEVMQCRCFFGSVIERLVALTQRTSLAEDRMRDVKIFKLARLLLQAISADAGFAAHIRDSHEEELLYVVCTRDTVAMLAGDPIMQRHCSDVLGDLVGALRARARVLS